MRVTEDYCAYLCLHLNLSPDSIVGHFEAANRGYASNHADPGHWMRRHGDSMDKFRERVRQKLSASPGVPNPPQGPSKPEPPAPEPEVPGYISRHKVNIRLTRAENATHHNVAIGTVITLDREDYLGGVVPAEIGNAPIEASKAQAIAARTFAYVRTKDGNIIDDTTNYQAYRAPRNNAKLYPHAINAVQTTKGQILCYNRRVVETAVYSASNGGQIISSKDRWGGERPYLVTKPDPWTQASGIAKNGHGVGMSQAGAIYAAIQGINHADILAFYYPGTNLCVIGRESEGPIVQPGGPIGKYMTVRTYREDNISLWSTTGKARRLIRVPRGERVFVIRHDNAPWVWAEYKGVEGFADSTYLIDAGDSEPNPMPEPEPPVKPEQPTDGAHMLVETRYAAGIGLWTNKAKFRRVIQVPKGETVTVINNDDEKWPLVEYKGKQGYADAQYLKSTSTTPPPPSEFTGYVAFVKTRFGRGIGIWTDTRKSRRLVQIPDGSAVSVIAHMNNNWAQVTHNGVTGFADRQYLIKQ